MQNEDKSAMASEAKNLLSDDDIIEFAETVLADLDDGDGGHDEEMALVEDDDDIIDLTEVAGKPESSDDFLELTEAVDIGPSAEEDVLELKDIAENAEGEEEVAFELADDIEDLMIEDDAAIDVDDEVDDPAGAAEDDADDREAIPEPYDFADEEEETVDLSPEDQIDIASSELEDEDADFDFEPAGENLAGSSHESPLSDDTGEEEILPEPENRVAEEYPAEGDPMMVDLEAQPLEDLVEDLIGGHVGNQIENQATDGQQEKLELTEADRRLLEEDLSLDIGDDTSTDITGDRNAAENADQPHGDTTDPDRYHRAEDDEPVEVANAPASLTAETAQPDFADASGGGTPETFDFDFDEVAEDVAAGEGEPPMTSSADVEELSVESLLADGDATGNAEPYQPIDGAEGTLETDDTGPPEPSETEFDMETQATGASEVKLNPPDTPDPKDGLTAADTTPIPATRLSAQRRADNDAPEDNLNETIPEGLSSAQLEAVVEQAVKKLFGEKIETMLSIAIEKAVTKEIDRLKTLILGDLDHDH